MSLLANTICLGGLCHGLHFECDVLCLRVQKDSHTLYLEQELESLKVVLEIKNNQLHQKEKKLMEMDKMVSITLSRHEDLEPYCVPKSVVEARSMK